MHRGQILVDKALTNLSLKYFNNSGFIADKVFPTVPVEKQSALFYMYTKDDWFRDDAALRAPGTESAGGTYDMERAPLYFCQKRAFHKDVFEEDRVNADQPINVEEDAVEFVVDKILLNKENTWARTFFKKGVWGTDLEGAAARAGGKVIFWNQPQSTPIQDVLNIATAMSQTTGKRPNTMVLGRYAFDALLQHPDLLDRVKFTQMGIINQQLIGTLLGIPNVYVADAIQNTAKKGDDAKLEFILGNNVLLTYTDPRPGIKKATAGFTFAWTGLMGSNAIGGRVNRIPMPHLGIGTERIEAELAYDMKVVAPDLGVFIENVVDPNWAKLK